MTRECYRVVVIDSTTSEERLLRTDGAVSQLPADGRSLGILEVGSRALFRGMVPIFDGSQKQMGALLIMQDVTPAYAEMKATRVRLIAVMVGMMVVLGMGLIGMIHKLVFRRFAQVIEAATRVVGGEFNRTIPRHADDEVGTIETLLDQFRQVFVNTLDELTAARNLAENTSGIMPTSEVLDAEKCQGSTRG